MKYNLYPGRYQPPHRGHMAIFNESLKKGEGVCIAIRDVEPDSKNPLFADQVKKLWEKVYKGNDLVKVIIIPDICAVKYGRGVGYEVEEIKVPDNIAFISATEIRKSIAENKNTWQDSVDEKIWEDIKNLLV